MSSAEPPGIDDARIGSAAAHELAYAGPPDVSVVVPTYNGQGSLRELVRRVALTLDTLGLHWELLLIDDASPDDTQTLGPDLQATQRRLRYQRLAENVGQHRATLIGMGHATGRVVVTMDDDLQHAPESIPTLLCALKPGVQVAIGRFDRSTHPAWRRACSRALSWAMSPRRPEAVDITSFKAFRREAADRVVAQAPEEGEFYLARVIQSALPRESLVNVSVPHHLRAHGRSSYRPVRLMRMAWHAVVGTAARRGTDR